MSTSIVFTLALASVVGVGAQPLDAGDGPSASPPATAPALPWGLAPTSADRWRLATPPDLPLGAAPVETPSPRGVTGVQPAWRWPLDPRPEVARRFSAPPTPYGPGHRGLDLRSRDGVDVLAVAAGEVTHAGSVAGRGTVTVAHPGGLSSTYEPVLAAVEKGDEVAAGDLLGILGAGAGAGTLGHCGTIACLHLGARRVPAYLDPLPLLVGGRAVLLPLAGLPR